MRVNRRQMLVSAAVVVGLLVPAAPLATAKPDPDRPSGGKQLLLQQMNGRVRTQSASPGPGSASGRLGQLATERDSGQVVIAVKVRPGANSVAATLATVTGSVRTQGAKQRRTLPQVGTVIVEVPEATATAFTARIRDRQDVAKVEVVPRRSLSLIPDDESYPATAPYLDAVTAPAAWAVHQSDPGALIAVVDSGVDRNHPDLTGRVVGTYNVATDGTDVTDTVGHGTFVAGVAAATHDNGIGIAGASMGADVLAVKVDDDGLIYADDVAEGVTWAADNGAKVINLSLGSPTSSQVERDAIAYAISKNVLVVAAAGNDATTAPSYPAAYPQVIAVGATDVTTGGRASFSNFGSWVTVAAPGVKIMGTTPTAGSLFFPSTSGYDVGDGTSFSSPIVAAEAALLSSLRPAVSAADLRQAIVKSSHGYSNLGLGAGQVDFRAAYDALRPDTVPTLTRPANGALMTGVVQLSAQSTAPKVRFLVDGVAVGAPIATSAGAANTTWTSWGLTNGPRAVTAVDCSLRDVCNASSTQVRVTLANATPTLTSPKARQTLSGGATFTATAPGGGLAFMINGVRRGFDATAPYALTYPVSSLSDGTHKVQARSCSVGGTACAGPASPVVSFTAKSLHPKFTAVSPSLFSPNGDGRYDTAKATYYLPDTEYVRFQVRNAAGTIVRGPSTVGTLTAGTRTLSWNGLLNGGARAGNGIYSLELATSRGTLRGFAVTRVTVDRTAPTMSSITGSGTTFNPYPDTYRDTFTTKLTLSERATITTTVRTSRGALIRSWTGSRSAGVTSILWNGNDSAGKRVAAGTYYWTLTAQDPAGNRRASARYSVVVSAKHLVTKTATVSKRGSQYYLAGGSDPSCAWSDKAMSGFAPYGVWLANVCDLSFSGPQIAAAVYQFTLPTAYSFTSLRIDTYGNSLGVSTVGAAFTRWATDDLTFTHEATVRSANAWSTLGTVAPTGLINGNRLVEATLYVPNDYDINDYDVSYVRLVVTYKMLV